VASPTPSPYPIPVPADPNTTVVSLVFLIVLFAVVSVLWWQVRRMRRTVKNLELGPWPPDDGSNAP
jgi:hypothetical protein